MRINVELTANTGSFETDFKRAAKAAEKRAKEIEKAFSQMGKMIGAAVAVGATALGFLVKKSIDAAAELDDLSQKTGIAVESLSRLQYAAGREGVEDLGASLAKLAKTIGTDAELFDALGIKTKNANGELRTTEEVLLDVADVFSKSADGTRKAIIAQELFGKSGAALIPLLNQGRAGIEQLTAEADRLGITISGNTAKAADDFNNKLYSLKGAVSGAVNQITAELLPSLNRIAEAMTSSTGGTSAFATAGRALGVVLETVSVLAANVAYVFNGIGREIGGIAAQAAALATGDFAGAGFIRDEMIADAKRARAEVDALSDSILNAKAVAASEGPAGGGGTLPDVEAMKKAAEEAAKARKKASEDAQKAAEKALQAALDAEEKQRDSIAAVIDALKEESATMGASTAQIEARKIAKLGGTEAEKQQAYELAKYIELQKLTIEQDKDRAAVLKETRTYAEVYADEIARLNVLFDNGTKDSAVYTRAVAATQKAFDEAEKAAEESTNSMTVFADQAARNMQDAFADFLFNPFEGGLKGMVRSFAQALQRMAAEALAANIFGSLTSAGGGGGLFSSLFSLGASYFSGGISSSGTYTAANIAGRAAGGPVTAGTPYMVGENGPELFMPNNSGRIANSMDTRSMMAGQPQNIRIVNAFDGAVVGDYLQTSDGEKLLDNYVRRNGAKIRNVLNS